MRTLAAALALASVTIGWTAAWGAEDPLMKEAQELFQPIPEKPPAVKDVVATPAMVEMGKALYFDPRLSESHNISCNTCHQVGLGGVDMLPVSIGHKSQKGTRNAPTVLNCIGSDLVGQVSDLGVRLRASDRSAQQATAMGWLC